MLVERMGHASGTVFDADIHDLDCLLSPQAEINLYRILQESVNNISKHAGAAHARITIRREPRELRVTIDDDGEGLIPEAQRPPSAEARRGLGLTGIAERVRMLGGTHAVRSSPGHGTTMTIRLPLSSAGTKQEVERHGA
jgi:signal transduction histidine kinase